MAREDKKGFVFYYDYQQHLELLSDAERGKLLIALLEYGKNGTKPQLEGAALMAFSFIQAQKDRDAAKYAETIKKRSEAGKKGGRPRKTDAEKESKKSKQKQNKAIESNEKQTETKKADTVTVTDTDTVTDTVTVINNPPIVPPKGIDAQERRFAEFWTAYPKKVGKAAALKSWKRVKPDAELFERIMQAVTAAKASEQWIRESGRYIPNPATWLNQGRWDDELTPTHQNERRTQHGAYNNERPQQANTGLSGFQMASG